MSPVITVEDWLETWSPTPEQVDIITRILSPGQRTAARSRRAPGTKQIHPGSVVKGMPLEMGPRPEGAIQMAENGHACAIEEITPDAAKQMLGAGNRNNRRLSEPTVRRYIAIIERGEWMEDSTDAIGLATDGAVVNGQHRLEAISRGGITVRALVVRNVRPEVVKIIDQGMSRSLSQHLTIDGRYLEPGVTASAAEWMYNMVGRFEKSRPTEYKPTIPQLLELLAEHPHLTDSLDPAGEARRVTPRLSKGIMTAYHYAFACANPDMADEFFSQLASGLDVIEYSPVYVLREKYIDDQKKAENKRKSKPEAAAYLVMAWEATVRGEALTTRALRWVRSGAKASSVPTVSGVGWLSEPPADVQGRLPMDGEV